MELRVGYQNTEIGVLPVDWEVKSIEETSKLKARIGWQGLTTAEYLEIGNFHLVTGTDFKNGHIKWSTCHYVEKIRYTQDKNIQLRNDDILITKDGTIGKVAFVNNLTIPATLNSGVFLVRAKRNNYIPFFVFYIFNSVLFSKFLQELVAGSTINHLYQKDFVNFQIPLPPLSEQTAIATVLSDTDKLLQALEKKIAKKRLIKQGAMQELLKHKEGWVVKTLGDVVVFLDGQRRPIKANERQEGIYPYYGASGIIDYVSDYIFDEELILLGEDGENILSRNLPLAFKVKGKIWVNNHAHVLKPKAGYHISFLTEYLESLDYSLLNSGTAQPKLNKHACLNIKLFVPSLSEQTKIATILSEMDTEIENLEKQLAKYKKIKQGLMQNLLTGKIRLV